MTIILEQKAKINIYGKEIPKEWILEKKVVEKPAGYSLWRIYEINIICRQIPKIENLKDLVNRLEEDIKGLKVIWIGLEDNVVKIQVTGNFAWSILLAKLPDILLALAIFFIAIIILLVVLKLPPEYLALAIIVIALPFSIIFAKSLYEKVKGE